MSSGRKKESGGGGMSVATVILPEAMEMVERVKEVVDLSDDEIYAALMACKMDPDHAANFLMSLDTFDEVESKCKNKTETKKTHESRSKIVSSGSTCGFTRDTQDGGPSISMQMSSSEFGVMHGKLVQEIDNGINPIAISSILSSGMAVNNSSQRLTPQSFQPNWSGAPAHPTMADTVRMSGCQGKDSSTPIVATAPADSINTSRSTGPVGNFSFLSQPPFWFQQSWSRAPGRPTMADIVRMGRCQQKASSTTIVATAGCQSKSCDVVGLNVSHSNSMLNQNTVLPVELNWQSHSSHDHVSNVIEINRNPGGSGIHPTSHEELSLADQPSVSSDQIVSEIFDASANYGDEPAPSSLHADGVDLSFLDDHQVSDGIIRCQNLLTKAIKSASVSDRQVDNSGYGFPHVYGHHEGAPTRPTMADTVRMVGHQGKASSTHIVQTASIDSMNTSQATGPVDNFSFSSRPPFSFQHNWSGAPARPTMADIVRMGRCKREASSTTIVATDGFQSKSCDAEIDRDPGGAGFRQHDEWSLADQPSVRSGPIVSEIFDVSANYADEPAPSSLHAYGADLSFLNDDQVLDGNIRGQNLPTKSTKSASASDRQVDNSGYGFPHVQGHCEADDAGMELSLAATNLQQLSLHEEHDTAPAESCHAVIIPEHLQVTNADGSCLSFGTSGSGITGPSTGAFIPRPPKSNLEVASDTDTNMPPIGQPDTGISEYRHDERIGPFLDDSVSFITGTSTDNYGMLSTSQPEVIRDDTFVALHTIQQNFPSASGYAFSNTTRPTAAAYTYGQANSHMQNLSAFSSAMALRPAAYLTSQRPTQSMPNTSISSGSLLTQHPTLPSYSQPAHPSGHHLPSAAIQQACSGSNAFQQSPAMLLRAGTGYIIPRARSGIYLNNFAPLADVASRHGGSWNSANIRRSYRGTPSSVSASRRFRYGEGAGGSQFIRANRFLPPRQGEYAPRWARGASRGTSTALPRSTSFSFPGRSQHGGVRERQQAAHFDASDSPCNHGSQAGFSEEHQQHLGEGNFDVSR
ncbi:uncharacterized protein [Elaeis guineensis]|uniref:uncharacterized protein isoform X2 n=1 Tax=Elaeis guineensis var. tenera TaxID=51953 RepID=UPI003C6D8D04